MTIAAQIEFKPSSDSKRKREEAAKPAGPPTEVRLTFTARAMASAEAGGVEVRQLLRVRPGLYLTIWAMHVNACC